MLFGQFSVGVMAVGRAPMRLERASHRLYRLMGVDSLPPGTT
jgi:hypothetical protein